MALEERCDGLAETFEGEVISEFVGLDADQTEQQNHDQCRARCRPRHRRLHGHRPGHRRCRACAPRQDLGLRSDGIGGFDITPELIDAIEAGTIAFTVDQQQYLQGYMPVLLLFLNVTNQNTLGGGLPILTGPGFVTPDERRRGAALVEPGTR